MLLLSKIFKKTSNFYKELNKLLLLKQQLTLAIFSKALSCFEQTSKTKHLRVTML